MYTPNYDSPLFYLGSAKAVTDYSMYVSEVLRKKHYGKTRKCHR